MEELTVTRAEYENGYLAWQGATCTRRPYELVRELPDGGVVVRGRPSHEPADDIERRIVELEQQDRERQRSLQITRPGQTAVAGSSGSARRRR